MRWRWALAWFLIGGAIGLLADSLIVAFACDALLVVAFQLLRADARAEAEVGATSE